MTKRGILTIIAWIVMALFLIIGFSSCGSKSHKMDTDTYYVNTKFILVEKEKCGESKTMIIRHPKKEFMYRELTNDNLVTDEMYYSYEVGDEMFFEYLRRDAFFAIDPEEDEYIEEF